MARSARIEFNYANIGKVALQSPEIGAVIASKTGAGVGSASAATGINTAEMRPRMIQGKQRWYGTYGAPADAESKTGGLSGSIGAMRSG